MTKTKSTKDALIRVQIKVARSLGREIKIAATSQDKTIEQWLAAAATEKLARERGKLRQFPGAGGEE